MQASADQIESYAAKIADRLRNAEQATDEARRRYVANPRSRPAKDAYTRAYAAEQLLIDEHDAALADLDAAHTRESKEHTDR